MSEETKNKKTTKKEETKSTNKPKTQNKKTDNKETSSKKTDTSKAAKKPAEKKASKPAQKPSEKKTSKPAQKPAEKKTTEKKQEKKPAEKKASKPAQKPAEKKPSKPAQKPVEKKTAEKKPTEPKPAAKKPEEKKPADKTPAVQKPAEKKSTPQTPKTTGQKFLHFFKRTDYNVNQNLRFISVILAVVLLFGMFQPLLGITYGLDIKASGATPAQNKTLEIIPKNTKYFPLNIGDLVVHKSLKDFEVFGTPIGDISLFGINLYDFITSPAPDFSGIQKPNNGIDTEIAKFLQSEQFASLCNKFLGDNAQAVIDVADTIAEACENSDAIIDKVSDKVSQMQSKLSTAKGNLVDAVHSVEGLVSIAETVVLLIVALFIAGVVLLCFKKLPRYLAPAIMTPVCVLFLGIGVGLIIVNCVLGSFTEPINQSLTPVLLDFLNTSLPDVAKMLEGILNTVNVNFVLTLEIAAGLGWWIMTICITGCTVFGYIIGRRNKGLVGEARN